MANRRFGATLRPSLAVVLAVSWMSAVACSPSRPCSDLESPTLWADTPFLFGDYKVCKMDLHHVELQGEHLRLDQEVDRIRSLVATHNWRPIRESYLHQESRYVYVVSTGKSSYHIELTVENQYRGKPVVLSVERVERSTPAMKVFTDK